MQQASPASLSFVRPLCCVHTLRSSSAASSPALAAPLQAQEVSSPHLRGAVVSCHLCSTLQTYDLFTHPGLSVRKVWLGALREQVSAVCLPCDWHGGVLGQGCWSDLQSLADIECCFVSSCGTGHEGQVHSTGPQVGRSAQETWISAKTLHLSQPAACCWLCWWRRRMLWSSLQPA